MSTNVQKKCNRWLSCFMAAVMLLSVLPVAAFAEEAVLQEGQVKVYYTDDDTFDIKGMFGGKLKSVTFGNWGFETYLRVDSNSQLVEASGEGDTVNGLTIAIQLGTTNGGKLGKVTYIVTNPGEDSITYSLGSGADIKIGGYDAAPITRLEGDRGFMMKSMLAEDQNEAGDFAQFNFFAKGTSGVTDVDNFWYGAYDSYTDELHYWSGNESAAAFYGIEHATATGTYDSAMSYSWKDRTIAPGETQTYSVLLGIGGAGSENEPENPSGGDDYEEPVAPDAEAVVDGQTETIGKVEKGDHTTIIKTDSVKMESIIEKSEQQSQIIIPVTESGTSAAAQVSSKNLEQMAQKGMDLVIQKGKVSYEMPANAVSAKAVADKLGQTTGASIPVTVTISEENYVPVMHMAYKNGFEIVGAPVSFKVTATYDGKTAELDEFSTMVSRIVEITADQAKRITTAIVYDKDGSLRHVPTLVYEKDGKYYAKINSMTNSSYVLIYNVQTFTDVAGKWYGTAAEEMASRKVIQGTEPGIFAGEQQITRAEFAAMLVAALGLPNNGKAEFSDVSADAWYYGAVGTAAQKGLMNGVGDNLFAPEQEITRQEVMTMVANAARYIGYEGDGHAAAGYTDYDQVAQWAQSGVAFNMTTGLSKGIDGQIKPNQTTTRSEAVVLLLRLLQQAQLVDVRTIV